MTGQVREVAFSDVAFVPGRNWPHSENPFERLSGFGKSAPNQLRYGMRYFRPPLFGFGVLVVASFFSGIIMRSRSEDPPKTMAKSC